MDLKEEGLTNLVLQVDSDSEPNSENCLDLIFVAPPCDKVLIVPDTKCITFAIRTFMLDVPSPGSFQNIGCPRQERHYGM